MCDRAFPGYRWKAGTDGRYKKTEICLTCAKLKNVCQTCLLDLEFGLPTQLRDAALPEDQRVDIPESEGNRNYFNKVAERKVEQGLLPYGKTNYTSNIIATLARTQPNFKRNRAHVCSFWMKGSCNRGDKCPYRHELPDEDTELSKQSIKDRYYGKNDPVADKLMTKYNEKTKEKEKRKLKSEGDEEIKDKPTKKPKKGDYETPFTYPSMDPQRMGSVVKVSKEIQ